MDPSWTRSASPAHTSRLPTKKKSSLSMRDVTDSLDKLDRRALATSPSAISDTSSSTDAGSATNGHGHGYGHDASRRSSTSSQQSQMSQMSQISDMARGTRIPRPSPSQRPSSQATSHQPLSIKDAYRMAQEEEAAAVAMAAQGSPSPAPRPWRNRTTGGGPKGTPTPAAPGAAAGASGRATPMSASESRMQKILAQSPLDIGGRRTARRIGGDGRDTPSRQRRSIDEDAGSTTDPRRIRYEEDQARMQVALGEKSGGLFSPKARVSPKIAVAGRELHRRASNTSLGERAEKSRVPVSVTTTRTPTATSVHSSLAARGGKPGSYLKRMVSAPENVAQTQTSEGPSSELESADSTGDVAGPPAATPLQIRSATAPSLEAKQTAEAIMGESPGKSFAWDADEDFTANDLMTSDSPRLAPVRDTSPSKSPQRPRNTKLDEIRRLELEADLLFDESSNEGVHQTDPDEILPSVSAAKIEDEHGDDAEEDDAKEPTQRRPGLPAERTNKTLDEIRAREDQHLSKRALSAMRLDEIRQQNAEARSKPLDAARKLSHEHLRAERNRDGKSGDEEDSENKPKPTKEDEEARAARDRSLYGDDSEQIPNTPITIYRTSSTDRGRTLLSAQDNNSNSGGSDNDTAKNASVSPAGSRKSSSSTHSRTESQELLRKLARVTTSVVAAAERKDKGPAPKNSGDNLRGILGSASDPALGDAPGPEKSVSLKLPRSRDADTLRPTVGFAQLRRQPSSESASTKRSSLAQSDGDPTDRIEAEMKLFAAGENHSERGSIRAPSPDEEEEDDDAVSGAKSSIGDEATPRPAKVINPLMQPTPRVTGAYVETPVTARTEKMMEVINAPAPPPQKAEPAKTIVVASSKADEKKRASTPLPGIIALLRGTASDDDNGKDKNKTEAQGDEVSSEAAKDVEGRFRRLSASRSNSASSQKSRSQSKSRSRSRSTSRNRPLLNSAKLTSARDDLLAIQRDQHIDDSTIDDFDELLAAAATNTEVADDKEKNTNKNKKDPSATDSERLRRMSQSISTYLHDVQSVKKGIERLEVQVSNPEKIADTLAELEKDLEEDKEKPAEIKKVDAPAKKEVKSEGSTAVELNTAQSKPVQRTKQHTLQGSSVSSVVKKEEDDESTTLAKTPLAQSQSQPAMTSSHIQLPVPSLYKGSNGSKKLTFFGVLVLLVSIWLAAESTTCALFCRPEACQSGQACQWSPADPTFGAAIPVKLDQWLTGGQGRVLAAWASDEIGDLVADAWDAATGTDIRQVDPTYFSFEEKRRHRRRLQKKGLVHPWTPPAEARPKLEAWRRAREAREQERRAREELGYGSSSSSRYGGGYDDGVDDDGFEDIVRPSSDRMVGDERVGGWW